MSDKTSRYARMSRRAALTAAALAGMVAMSGCGGSGGAAASAQGDMALGAAEGAKVTVVEYASVTCGHCAAWQEEVWPEFKTKYIDSGKIRYVFREYPTPPEDIAVAGFLIARCAPDGKYFDVVHEIMASQKEWQAGVPPLTSLQRIASSVGLNQQQFQQCVTDQEAIKAMDARIMAGRNAGVTGTPTFIVNGERVVDITIGGLSTAIDAALAK